MVRARLVAGIALVAAFLSAACGVDIGGWEFDPQPPPDADAARAGDGPAEPPPSGQPIAKGVVASVGTASPELAGGFSLDDRTTVFVLATATVALDGDTGPQAIEATDIREGDVVRIWGDKPRRGTIEAFYVLIDDGH